MTAPFTPDALNTIRRNAGRVPPERIAAALGWPVSQLERVARKHGLELRIDLPPHNDAAEFVAETESARRREARYGNLTVNLSHADYAIMLAKAKEHNLKRATLVSALVKGALTSGHFDALVAIGRKELRR